MANNLKQSSTSYPLLFLMVDSSDHISAKTGLSPTVTLSKNGGSFASPSGAVTEIGSGWYKVAGNATDTNTVGPLILHATATGADPCDVTFFVGVQDPSQAVPSNFSSLSIDSSGRVNLIPSQSPSVANGTAGAGSSTSITLTGQSAVDSFYVGCLVCITSGTGAGQSRIITGYVGSTKVATVNTAWATNPDNTSVYTVISEYLPVVDSSLRVDVGKVGGTAQTARDIGASVLVGDKTGFSLSSAGVQAIWDALTSALTTANSIGKRIVDNLDAAVSSRLASSGYTAPDNTSISAIKAKTDNLPSSPAATSDIPTATTVAAAVWNYLTSSATTVGSLGKRIADYLDAAVSSRLASGSYTGPDNASIAAIKAKTDNLPALPTAVSDIPTASAIRAEMDSNSTKLANLDTTVSSRATVAGVWAAVVDSPGVTTLLSRLSAARAGYLDTLNGIVSAIWAAVVDSSGVTSLLTRLTSTRAGYLDNLSGGAVATLASVQAIQNSTLNKLVVAGVLQIPASSSKAYQVELLIYNEAGTMQAPDSVPTFSARLADGTSLSSRFGSVTTVSTGRYRVNFTVQSTDSEGDVLLEATYAVGGQTLVSAASSGIYEDIVSQFTSTDRANLDAVKTVTDQFGFRSGNVKASTEVSQDKTGYALSAGEHTAVATDVQAGLTAQGYTATRAGYLDVLSGIVAAVASAVWGAATRTLSAFGFTVNTNPNSTEAAIKAQTDLLPADPASTTNVSAAVTSIGTSIASNSALLQRGVCQGGSATTIVLDSGSTFLEHAIDGLVVMVPQDKVYGTVESYTPSTKEAVVHGGWPDGYSPPSGREYRIFAMAGAADVTLSETAVDQIRDLVKEGVVGDVG